MCLKLSNCQHVKFSRFSCLEPTYVTLYMQNCSRNANWLLCSNNVKSQPNLNFYILLSDKNRRWGWRWLQAIFVGHNSIKDFVLLAS